MFRREMCIGLVIWIVLWPKRSATDLMLAPAITSLLANVCLKQFQVKSLVEAASSAETNHPRDPRRNHRCGQKGIQDKIGRANWCRFEGVECSHGYIVEGNDPGITGLGLA